MRSFVKLNTSRNGKITLLFTDIRILCQSREFLTSQICLLMLFAKIKLSRNFPNLQYLRTLVAQLQFMLVVSCIVKEFSSFV